MDFWMDNPGVGKNSSLRIGVSLGQDAESVLKPEIALSLTFTSDLSVGGMGQKDYPADSLQ